MTSTFSIPETKTVVLIETYWNVNTFTFRIQFIGKAVLIETYWNVNLTTPMSSIESAESLNRNILECKFTSLNIASVVLFVLIETYWNVNLDKRQKKASSNPVLIETYWNVN